MLGVALESAREDAAGAAGVAGRAAPGVLLDLHEGISTPHRIEDPRTGCKRWPEHLRLLNLATGELVVGRCRATNLCRYCQQLYVLETVEMLTLDALEHAPTIWVVLTAREHLTRPDTYRHLEKLRAAARRRWPAIEWFVQVEFQRRGALHLNLLVKGVGVGERQELHELLSARWCARVDAEPVGQWSGTVSAADGLVRYLQKTLSHGLKHEQAPPMGWRGHRTSQTRGYLVRPASVMRLEAREALAIKREIWRAHKRGLTGLEAEQAAHTAREQAAAASWRLADVTSSLSRHAGHGGEPAFGIGPGESHADALRPETGGTHSPPHPLPNDSPSQPPSADGWPDARQRSGHRRHLPTALPSRSPARAPDEGVARSPEPVPRR